ncbi:hypothetical protein V8B97DRAFT_1981412 [Scleroderma yunnanense]
MPVSPALREEFDQEVISVQQHTPSNPNSPTPCPEATPHCLRVYCPEIQWQNPQIPCEHIPDRHLRPRTVMFQIAAKLSIQHDEHLVTEAQNYQNFPDHFFQHRNGYNIVRPLLNPVPMHTLVPQFYGYYVPGDVAPIAIAPGGKAERPAYLSPIFLLEDCGTPYAKNASLSSFGSTTLTGYMSPLQSVISSSRSKWVEEREGGEFRFAEGEGIKLFNVSLGAWFLPSNQ